MSTTSTIKNVATQAVKKTFQPTRTFFRVSENIPSIQHARTVFKSLGSYGSMAEYKLMRCPETLQYLRYGFVVYKNKEDAEKAMADQFIKVTEGFKKPVEIIVEKSSTRNVYKNNRSQNRKQ